jgi:hypothetical protein
MGRFTENRAGVHIWNPALSEHTLCGDAFDAPESEPDWADGPFVSTQRTTVTCPRCVAIIRGVQGVRTRQAKKDRTYDV